MERLTGIGVSAGVAVGRAVILTQRTEVMRFPIPPDRVEPFLQRLPVDALWGVGPVTAEKLRARGIHRLVDVRTFDDHALRQAVGSMAEWLKQLAHGIDDRPVVAHRESKSSGSENTYPEDLIDIKRSVRRSLRWQHAVVFQRRALLASTGHDVSALDFTTVTAVIQAPRAGMPAICRHELCSCCKDGPWATARQAAWRERPHPDD